MEHPVILIRRGVIGLKACGDKFTLAGEPLELSRQVFRFAKIKKIPVEVVATADGITVTRVEVEKKKARYAQIADLQPGQDVLIEAQLRQHQSIRVYASLLGAKTGRAFSCRREGFDIRVTRVDGVTGDVAVPAKPSRWGLEALGTVGWIRVECHPKDQLRLRSAVSQKARLTGWRLTCMANTDGSMTVARVDDQAPPYPDGMPETVRTRLR